MRQEPAAPFADLLPHSVTVRTFLLVLLLARALTAAALPPDLSLSQLQRTAWTTTEGAPADIWALTQSAEGFLLLGTGSGLYRFDGVTFERVVSSNESDLVFRDITALLALPSGELWTGYYAGGVSQLKDGVLTTYGHADGLPTGWVTSFARERDGTLWVAALGGLGRFSAGHWETMSSNWNFPGRGAKWVLLDRRGTLWVAAGETVVFLRRGSNKFEDTGIGSGYRGSTLALAPDGTVWLAGESIAPRPLTQGNVLVTRSESSPGLDPSKRILVDRDGALWATDSHRGGIYRATLRSSDAVSATPDALNAPEVFGEAEGLTSDRAVPLLEDREGNIWVGTNLGLNRFRATPFVPEWHVPSSPQVGYSMAAGPNGAVWIASDDQLFEIQGRRCDLVARLPSRVRSAYRDPSGVVWLGTEKGLIELDHNGLKFLTLPAPTYPVHYEYVHAMTSDDSQGLWVSVVDRGLLRLHDGVWDVSPSHFNLADTAPTALWTDAAHRQWFGYSDGTVTLRERHNSTRVFGPNEGLRVGPITVIYGSAAATFVAGEWGLARFDGRQFRTLSASRLDAFSGITGIIVGAKGDIWVSGNRGVVHISSDAIDDAYDHPLAKLRYELFDVHDGLPGYAQQGEDATALAGADGRLWFATNHGVAWIDPDHSPRNRIPPNVVIRSVQADGRSYPNLGLIELPRSTRSVRIDYTALSIAEPERVRFRYRLDGADDDWRDATNERSIDFSNLRSGRYIFRVTASNNDNVWNDVGANVVFAIPPAYYQTTWFLVVASAAFAGLLWILYYARLRQITDRKLRRLEQRMEDRLSERTRIARDLHDTLLQSLQGLLLRYQVAYELLPGRPAEAKQDLGSAIDRTVSAINEGRNAVQDLRTSSADGDDLAVGIKALAEELASDHAENDVVFRVGLEGTSRPLHPVVRDEIYKIAGEALRNSRRHSKASEIEVDLRYDEWQLRLRVRDNGSGIDPKFLSGQEVVGHYGLHGMRERAELVGGKLAVWTAAASGTEIELTVPAARAYTAAPVRLIAWLSGIFSRIRSRGGS
jgi:signal transduction histidine kinase/ligand-binding sensor domain-containing protein